MLAEMAELTAEVISRTVFGRKLGREFSVEQGYAFINAMFDPQMAGLLCMNTGYNSAVAGAAEFAGEDYKKQFNEVYNAENLANLWWWQADTPWFAPLRQEYVDKITNA